jgi:hypothetical protein
MTMKKLLHRATHRIPGVPAHAEPRPAGHHGTTQHGTPHSPNAERHTRQARFLPGWQRRIAALFGQER